MLLTVIVFILYIDILALSTYAFMVDTLTVNSLIGFYFGATFCVLIVRACFQAAYIQSCSCSRCKRICPVEANYCRYCGLKLR